MIRQTYKTAFPRFIYLWSTDKGKKRNWRSPPISRKRITKIEESTDGQNANGNPRPD